MAVVTSPTTATGTPSTEAATFQFVASWLVFLTIMVAATRTRVGYVIVYYILLLLILLILVTEYAQIAPFLSPPTLGQLNGTSGG